MPICQFCNQTFNSLRRHYAQPTGSCHQQFRDSLVEAKDEAPYYYDSISRIIDEDDVASGSDSDNSTAEMDRLPPVIFSKSPSLPTSDALVVDMRNLAIASPPIETVSLQLNHKFDHLICYRLKPKVQSAPKTSVSKRDITKAAQDAKVHRSTHIVYHENRPDIEGWSEPRTGIFADPLTPEKRLETPFHPFSSAMEWEVIESIAQMGLTDGNINHLLGTEYVCRP
jgi:hypothetical protein